MDKVTTIDLACSLQEIKKVSDEAEFILEQKKAPRGTSLEDSRTAHGDLGAGIVWV